jgi:photosystem II stability/assembly factor-like uncharacterized protein
VRSLQNPALSRGDGFRAAFLVFFLRGNKMNRLIAATIVFYLLLLVTATGREEEASTSLKASTFSGLKLRGIGPALMSGRISDIAVHPAKQSTWYVAVACGGVWKTTNAGTTWTPIFDGQGSYSIGCVTVDPNRPSTVWVGTGENNSQRSVGYGDGVYRSLDGGKSWKKAGLEKSEHIGKIVVDPRDSDVVYVASQGPLWAPGGDRGLFKTRDGGETWSLVLEIDENTGVTDIVFDPRDPDVLYAASYQRRRHVWTLIDGGPGSAIHKSRDGGATWKKLGGGLPEGDVGRIGLAVSPIKPDVLYALVEASGKGSGFYRSANGGESWEKRSTTTSRSPQYYQEIYADPRVFDRLYSMDTRMKVTDDGGKTFRDVGEKNKHVDNHALAFHRDDPDYLLAGCDGGVYESFDLGKTWSFKANLPVTQFYKCCVDNDLPFYNVYGGTQDNSTQGGPSRTRNVHGITNRDWFLTLGGDGFKPQVDPLDADIVYSQLQHGVLVRFDRRTGERISIMPRTGQGEEALRWNWDSPLLISPHSHKRLYFAANRVFRSDDRGDSWRAVSPDLTRRIDRNTLEVMGRVWSVDAVAKSNSTSFYGNIVSLAESPLVEGLLYAGTDDGLIQVSENGGGSWRSVDSVPGVPDLAYVADLEVSLHEEDTVFAVFNNHKMGDFKPYILESRDRGRTWAPLAGDLPERGSVWAVAQDHVAADIFFAGTEFGLFFTVDRGAHWIRLKGDLPVIAIRDLEIQRRENDLVAASFGRGFFILDDYASLRGVSEESLAKEALLFPVRKAPMFVPATPLGGSRKGSQGDAFFTAPNPPGGAVFTYYLKEGLETARRKRRDEEKKIAGEKGAISYPSWEELRSEDREEEPAIIFTIRDAAGRVVRRLTGPVSGGFHRVAWNLRYPAFTPTSLKHRDDGDPWNRLPVGPFVQPGKYTVDLAKRVAGKATLLCEAVPFECEPLGLSTLPPPDREELLAFQMKTGRLQRALLGAREAAGEARERIKYAIKAIHDTPGVDPSLGDDARQLGVRLDDLLIRLTGDSTRQRRNEPVPPSILNRVQGIVRGHWSCLSAPTATQREAYGIAAAEFTGFLESFRVLVEEDLKRLEENLDSAGAPWTPGRLPRWETGKGRSPR